MRRRILIAFAILLAGVVVFFLACVRGDAAPSWGPQSEQLQKGSLSFGGRERTYLYFKPLGAGPFPLMLALHGRGGDGASQEQLSGISQVAARERFMVVYPDGYRHSWHDMREMGPAAEEGIDDVGFLSALIDELVAKQGVDPKRVYAMGMSNGAMMTLTLACRIPEKLAGAAAVTGLLAQKSACAPGKPISIALMVGDADPLVPYGGGEVAGNRGAVHSARESLEILRKANGCADALPDRMLSDVDPGDGTSTSVSTWTHCQDGVETRLYSVKGGGHTWPGGWQYLAPRWIGVTARDFSASEEIWAFLSPRRRP